MNFSVTTEYALRVMSFMAMKEERLYATKDLFENLHIPFRYLRKLMFNLSKSDLLDSVRGKNGGYKLARSAKDITLLQVIEASGEEALTKNCFFGYKECNTKQKCIMHDRWTAVRHDIYKILSTTTLLEIKKADNLNFITNLTNKRPEATNEDPMC